MSHSSTISRVTYTSATARLTRWVLAHRLRRWNWWFPTAVARVLHVPSPPVPAIEAADQ